MKRKLIYFIAIFLLMLVTAVFWGTWFAVSRSAESFTAAEFIQLDKAIISNVDFTMLLILPFCCIMMILSLWFYRYKRSTGFYLGLLSFFLIIASFIITLTVISPIDNQVKHWAATSLPPQWEYLRDRWKLFQALRGFVCLVSFGCFCWFIISGHRKNRSANY